MFMEYKGSGNVVPTMRKDQDTRCRNQRDLGREKLFTLVAVSQPSTKTTSDCFLPLAKAKLAH